MAVETHLIDAVESKSSKNLHTTLLRTALGPWICHFRSSGYIKGKTLEFLDSRVIKKTLERTVIEPHVREAIGSDEELWQDFVRLFEVAIPSLEKRSFAPPDPLAADLNGASGTMITSNYDDLVKDLERLNSLVVIARNALTTGEESQNLAAKSQFDAEIFKLIGVCVKVTARGYEGDGETADEEKWQMVVNSYKKVLITCLQFLNNLVARNERRKLMLWLELFDSFPDGVSPDAPVDSSRLAEEQRLSSPDYAQSSMHSESLSEFEKFSFYMSLHEKTIPSELNNPGKYPNSTAVRDEFWTRWQSLPEGLKNTWNIPRLDMIKMYHERLTGVVQSKSTLSQDKSKETAASFSRKDTEDQSEANGPKRCLDDTTNKKPPEVEVSEKYLSPQESNLNTKLSRPSCPLRSIRSLVPIPAEVPEPPHGKDTAFKIPFTAEYGAEILKHGKDDLMRRLETYSERVMPANEHVVSPKSPVASSPSPSVIRPVDERDAEDQSEVEGSEEDEYVVPGDDIRILLTDIPLILGPSEIEVLPMIIMSGIVPPPAESVCYGNSAEDEIAINNMHSVRCHLLLAQENGRSLLRELLVFVAAWGLREDELYFKFMVKIMDSILKNGLMPFSYHVFRESKDIISPSQAVIMKLLTNIFRLRRGECLEPPSGKELPKETCWSSDTLRIEAHMVNYLFTEFRRNIIPQTCALIFLQGQIHSGNAHPEDFPLNSWDMERMYEGLYQYLEFFAVLTEQDTWKRLMVDWEITSELMTLLKELDAAIPNGGLNVTIRSQGTKSTSQATDAQPPAPPSPPKPVPIAVERPYVSTPAITKTNSSPPGDSFPPAISPYPPPSPQSEPSDFEWRNLKKLTVLVLSSLLWKNSDVQGQLRKYGGIEALLNCCKHDENNPYIKEHAIMCLRFALERNQQNQEIVRKLERQSNNSDDCKEGYPEDEKSASSAKRTKVPREVLDQGGYETFMDSCGVIGLRKKETTNMHGSNAMNDQQSREK